MIKTLPKQFERSGFAFLQLERDGNIALYERKRGRSRIWEVITIEVENGVENFSKTAWQYTLKDNAYARYQSELKNRK